MAQRKGYEVVVLTPSSSLGASQALDFYGVRSAKVFASRPRGFADDARALAGDWNRVGQNFRTALQKLDERRE